MAALYDGDGNRLFTMDYTGVCDKPERYDPCDHTECPFHNEDYRHDCMEDMDIWIPDCGTDTD